VQEPSTRSEGLRGGPSISGSQVRSDEEPMSTLSKLIYTDGFGGVTRCQRGVAVRDPCLGQAFERAQSDLGQPSP
jgi:hypothetical protein